MGGRIADLQAMSSIVPESADPAPPSPFALALAQIAVDAGAAAIRHFRVGCPHAAKGDGSPVTLADEDAEAVILAGLRRLEPQMVIVAEESCAKKGAPPAAGRFALVDPVDGTREFLACEPEFTVNIAVIEGGAPVIGCVYAPALALLFLGEAGRGAWKAATDPGEALAEQRLQPIAVRQPPAGGMTALVSRSHLDAQTEAYLERLGPAERLSVGSSLKFCWMAEGRGDVYPRFQRVMEWDIAAGHAVLAAAGGRVETPEGLPVRYGQADEEYRAPMFIAWGAAGQGQLRGDPR
jgi:3'(2'), 5'-bisphosphate nucleotidase